MFFSLSRLGIKAERQGIEHVSGVQAGSRRGYFLEPLQPQHLLFQN